MYTLIDLRTPASSCANDKYLICINKKCVQVHIQQQQNSTNISQFHVTMMILLTYTGTYCVVRTVVTSNVSEYQMSGAFGLSHIAHTGRVKDSSKFYL